MKLSLSVTHPAPPLRYITGVSKDFTPADLKPGMLHVIPEPEPMVLVEAEADGMEPAAVAAVLRSAADAVEQIGRHGLLTVGARRRHRVEVVPPARHRARYNGALADRAAKPYVGRHAAVVPGYATGGYIGVNR